MKSNEIRFSFLEYFAGRGHKIVPSAPLIPHDDPTLLFINAGMNQFKNVFIGLENRDYKTAVSSQKCIRAGGKHNDLENVGFTARHHTFFEMLGNFSFGDYFKEDAIAYAWEYIIKTLGLDPSRLYATVYNDDDDAEKLWKKIAPELKDRVLRFGEKDNFWSMGDTGPCGPCSEIHYDRGESYPGELNGGGDRFMEIWNLVFMQYNRDESGNMTPLPKPSVDTGAGLERFCMILQNSETNYGTDLFTGLLEKVSEISGVEYSEGSKGASHRVIVDHVRALTFAIADGGVISNEGRGYVLRRILRRAAWHGQLLGLHEPFLYKAVSPLVELMGGHYPEIKSKQGHIELVLKSEEEQFGRTLDTGCEKFENIAKIVKSSGSKIIPGDLAFPLYDTYGLPIDLIVVMAKKRGLQVDMEGFESELVKQRERSKKSATFYLSPNMLSGINRPPDIDPFVGYKAETYRTNVLAATAFPGLQDELVLLQTPFYAESGGQVGDKGIIECDHFTLRVDETHYVGTERVHKGTVERGSIPDTYDGIVTATIDSPRRADIQRNHTATHLLHKALKEVLGDHVNQSGSLVDNKKLRFDFTYPKALTAEEINKVENKVKEKISEKLKMHTPENDDSLKDLTIEKAREMDAMALFGEKYGDIVRVIKTSDNYSIELCGGTHVKNTADIGDFFIVQEAAIAAGTRRIEAYTGTRLQEYYKEQKEIITRIKDSLGKNIRELSVEDVSELKSVVSQADRRILKRENLEKEVSDFLAAIEIFRKRQKKEEQSRLSIEAISLKPAADISGGKLLVYVVSAKDMSELMVFSDRLRQFHNDSTVVIISRSTGGIAVTSRDDDFKQNVFSEIKSISGARGGGKPTIRGSMPKNKIDTVITGLKKRFG